MICVHAFPRSLMIPLLANATYTCIYTCSYKYTLYSQKLYIHMYMHLVFAFIIIYVCMYMYYSMQAYTKLDQGKILIRLTQHSIHYVNQGCMTSKETLMSRSNTSTCFICVQKYRLCVHVCDTLCVCPVIRCVCIVTIVDLCSTNSIRISIEDDSDDGRQRECLTVSTNTVSALLCSFYVTYHNH